jgi:hypothetical protein
LRFCLLGSVILLTVSNVWAANWDGKERAAKKACLLGDAKKGTAILADLYLDTDDPIFIYNQGRCFEQNGKKAQAILRFEEYLRKVDDLEPADAAAIRKRIDGLQADLDRKGKTAPPPAPASTPVPAFAPATSATSTARSRIPPSAASKPEPEPLGIVQSAPTKPKAQEGAPVHKRWWFWTGIGAVVVGGVVTAVLLGSKSAPRYSTCDPGVVACAATP